MYTSNFELWPLESAFTYLYELPLYVPLDHGGPGVGVGHHLEGGVDRHLAVHGEESVDRVGQVHAVQRGQGHRRVDLKKMEDAMRGFGELEPTIILQFCPTLAASLTA